MRWGLIALNGIIASSDILLEQMKRVVKTETFDFVVGVDGGCKLLEKLGFVPDLILGDFDSIENLERFKMLWPTGLIKTFPPEKDYTDAELAFDEIAALPLDRVLVIGGFGGRADHMLSVMHLLMRAENCVMVDELNIIEKVQGPYSKALERLDYEGMYLSLVPLLETFEGITLSGFKYPLDHATIAFSQTLGISNEIVAPVAYVEVQKGLGYLIASKDRAKGPQTL